MDWMKEAIAQAAEAKPVPLRIIPARVPGRVLHVDGDYLAYYCAGNADCSPGRARQNVRERIETGMIMSGATKAVVHLTMSGSHKGHRYIVATVKPYQGHRSGAKPDNWQFLRDYLEGYNGEDFKVVRWTEREADDGIAYASYIGRDVVVYTRDKDMRMLPGLHLNWVTSQLIQVPWRANGMPEFDVLGEDGLQYGLKWFFLQLLQGDGADNIPGLPVPRLGPKTAEKILTGLDYDASTACVQARYKDFYKDQWSDRLAEQSCLLWLRSDPKASVNNWLRAWPEDANLIMAAERLEARVEEQLNVLREIGCNE